MVKKIEAPKADVPEDEYSPIREIIAEQRQYGVDAQNAMGVGALIHELLIRDPDIVAAQDKFNALDRMQRGPTGHIAARNAALEDLNKTYRQKTVQMLRKIRPFGNQQLKSAFAESEPSRKALRTVQAAQSFFPDDWIAASEIAGGFRVQQGTKTKNIAGSYNHGRLQLSLEENAPVPIAMHELAHRMEQIVPGLREVQNQFFQMRTGGRTEGLPGFPASYRGNEDRFASAYIGRVYDDGVSKDPYAFEILTMGLEGVFYGKYKLREWDTEHYQLILGILASI